MSPFIFILASLATFRLSVMFSKESGPGRIFKKLRGKTEPGSAMREGITCTLCNSIWWSALITVALAFLDHVPWNLTPIYWLAVSGVAVVLNQTFTKDL